MNAREENDGSALSEPLGATLREAPPTDYESPDPMRPASSTPAEPVLIQPVRHDPYAALRIGNYRLYSVGWVLSVIGQQVQEVAVGWDVFSRTKAEANLNPLLALGLVGGVVAIPVIALAIPAGELADRFDRRKIIMATMLMSAVTSLWLAWLSHVHGSLALMYTALLLGSTASAMGWPARSALLPQIVPAEVFANAATWNSSAFQVASMLGPALGGLVLYWSTPAAYLIDVVMVLAFAWLVMMVKVQSPPRARPPITFKSLAAGIRFVIENQIILATMTLDLFAVLLGGATALLPAFARDILHVGPGGFGLLRAAPALGALAMALVQAHRPPMKHAGRDLIAAVCGFGLATIVFGLSHHFALSLAMLLLTGAFDNVSVVVRHTLVQLFTPDSMRGRVSAVNNIFIGASNELGGFESGVTAWWLGAAPSVVLGGIGTLAVVAAVALLWPQLARLGSLSDARPANNAAV